MVAPYHKDDHVALYHGDALAVLAELPSGCVDAVVTDPPYSSGGMFRSDRTSDPTVKYLNSTNTQKVSAETFSGDNRDQRGYRYWAALWLTECLRVVKPGGVAMLFTDWRQLPTTTDALQSGGWMWRGIIPWHKGTSHPDPGRFQAHCEYVVWGSAGQMTLNRNAERIPGFYEEPPPRGRQHPTQKPLMVMRKLMKIVPFGGVVFDPFMGSGTTGAAAVLEGRKFIGVEQVRHYAEVAEQKVCTALGLSVAGGSQDTLEFEAVL